MTCNLEQESIQIIDLTPERAGLLAKALQREADNIVASSEEDEQQIEQWLQRLITSLAHVSFPAIDPTGDEA